MKKLISLLLVLVLCVSVCPAWALEAPAEEEPVEIPEELVVGTLTQMNGNFFSTLFGNNTSDLDVRQLLHGYSLVKWESDQGIYTINETVVSGTAATQNAQGDRTYTLALMEDLAFSNGTPITAYDYAFAMLFSVSPEVAEIGGAVDQNLYLQGAADYLSGASNVLTGVHVLNDYMLSVTIDHSYLPYFYELGMLNFTPLPIHQLAPECMMMSGDNGVFIGNREQFTAEMLKESVASYMTLPKVVSGPYTIVSFDGEEAKFERNPYYHGDGKYEEPAIEKITLRHVTSEQALEQLASGEMHLLNKALSSETINGGMALVAEGDHQMTTYPRRGLSFVSFCMESEKVQSQAVRQAMYLCMDQETLVSDYTGNYGLAAKGYWGIGQWMYTLINGTEPYPEDANEEEWKKLTFDNIPVYELDIEKAKELLAADGWTKNAAGADFAEGADEVRCKETENGLIALDLTLVYPENNKIADMFPANWLDNLAQAGIRVTLEAAPMNTLLEMYYRQTERTCDMMYLASNFHIMFDPSITYDPADSAQGVSNVTGIADEKLYQLALDMRNTEPGDTLTYCQKWLDFEAYWMEVLPALPVYCNVYIDFYTALLQDYVVNDQVTWSQAILNAWLGEAEEAEELEENELEEEGTVILD